MQAQGIGNFFLQFQISYWGSSVSCRSVLHCGVIPGKPSLGGRS